jgi:hypothetical protein
MVAIAGVAAIGGATAAVLTAAQAVGLSTFTAVAFASTVGAIPAFTTVASLALFYRLISRQRLTVSGWQLAVALLTGGITGTACFNACLWFIFSALR